MRAPAVPPPRPPGRQGCGKSTTSAIRTSVSFEPSDRFNALIMYQHMDRAISSFPQVAGPGAGYNGPAIEPGDRLSVEESPQNVHPHFDQVTAQLDSRIWGQHLSYVGSYAFQKVTSLAPQDNGNLFPGDSQKILLCNSSGSSSREPLWNATLTSEYSHPVSDEMDGFLRGLLTYYPKNNRRSVALDIQNYSLLNVYAGLRSHDGAWEVSVFAKNAFETNKTTSLDANDFTVSGSTLPITTGYVGTTYTPRREVGVNVHYAFGSR